jgi:hypothetical protein
MIQPRDFVPRAEIAVEFEVFDRLDAFGEADAAGEEQGRNHK